MTAKTINDFFDELGRCELSPFNDKLKIEQHTYNMITGAQGTDYYFLYLQNMYDDFVKDLHSAIINEDKEKIMAIANSLYHRINEILDKISYFPVPTNEDINSLQRDISARQREASSGTINELHRMQFFANMTKVQKYYAEHAKSYLENILAPAPIASEPQQETQTPQPIQPYIKTQDKYVYGLLGIMELLSCGKNKAQNIVKDEKYKEAIHKDGRKYIIDTEKFLEIMRLSNQPKERRPQRRKNTQNNR